MSNQSTPVNHQIYHIFLASPGDMNNERQLVRDFFEQYNRNNANQYKLEFKVINWENYSSIGVGRPQQLITEQTLNKYKESLVLVVGLLGQRFGTPTDIYQSGTEEEFETVVQFRQDQGDWPEIKWFFREDWGKQGPPKSPIENEKANEQWKKVWQFREKIEKENSGVQLYTKSFPTTDDFEAVFREDIERWLNDPARQWNQSHTTKPVTPSLQTLIPETPYFKTWQRLLAAECAHLPLEILQANQGLEQADPIHLPDIFVPLKAIAPSTAWKETRKQNISLAKEMAAGGNAEPEPVMEILQQQRMAVVIGDPGSGKSALVNQITWSLLNEKANKKLPENLQNRIPLRIILRHVKIPNNSQQGQATWLWDTIEKGIKETLDNNQQAGQHATAVLELLKQKLMQSPGGVILLDGLDEVPVANNHRIRLLQAIQALVSSLPEQTRFIVTARPYAYTDPSWRLADFTEFFLTPFDQEQRKQFIEGWYDAARKRFMLNDDDLKQRIPDFIARVEDQQHLRELAERPLLLTLIAILHASGGRLPDDRAQLYKDSIELLLYYWRQEPFRDSDGQLLRIDNDELLHCLQILAYNAHKAQRQKTDSRHTADLTRDAIVKAFQPILQTLGQKDLFAFLEQHTGILIAREQNYFAFPHRSFQEYLAMGWLTAQLDDALSPEVFDDPIWWREVFLLAVIEQKKKPRIASSYIRDLLEYNSQATNDKLNRLSILGGLALIELSINGSDKLTQNLRNKLVKLIEDSSTLNVNERAEAGRVLGRIGDHRPGVEVTEQGLPDIDWVCIPDGIIKLEKTPGTFTVKSFYLARYPVTNAQYQCFINDPEGYANPDWRQELDKQPGTPGTSHWPEANHPRETVTWFEAMAFCAWLSEQLGKTIRLPTEWEWQQAACSGQADFNYPWGAKYKTGYANINETWNEDGSHDLGRTTAVGLYPQGDSKQGVSDLSGNVWEWCLNGYEEPNNKQTSGTFQPVVRGGSWVYSSDYARSSARGYNSPDSRNNRIGFRLCCVSPI